MRTVKSVFMVLGGLGPVLYCAFLAYNLFDVGGTVQDVADIGLGPTVVGLGVTGLLFCIPLGFRIRKLLRGPRTPGSDGRGPTPSPPDDDDGFDADAAIARYLAQRAAEPAPERLATGYSPKPGYKSSGGAKRPGFGRRVG